MMSQCLQVLAKSVRDLEVGRVCIQPNVKLGEEFRRGLLLLLR
jgi:hypothetical protein